MQMRTIPKATPAVSMPTSRILGPLSGTNRWIVSSAHAAKKPPSKGSQISSAGFVRSIRVSQLRQRPRQQNSVKCASFRRSPWPVSASSSTIPRTANTISLTHPLMAPEISPGIRELPQISARLQHSNRIHRRSLFDVFSIMPTPQDAPEGS